METVKLVRAMKLRDLVLFNLVAVLGLRHLAASAKAGPGSISLWILAAIFFFIPQGLAVIELSSRFPASGGVYNWTKLAFGETHGFICGWCYWVNNVLYYPTLLISTAVIATYAIGKGDSDLKNNLKFIVISTLIGLWIAVALNIVGVGTGKWLQNLGGIGTYVPGIVVILFGLYAVFTTDSVTTITLSSLTPKLGDYDSLNLWVSIAFAYAGLELSSTMGDEVENPRKNFPRSIYISAPLIAIAYLLGTLSVLWLVPATNLNIVSGFLQTINNGAVLISGNLAWIGMICAGLYTIGNLGGVGAWLVGPARVAFAIGLDDYFPKAFGRVHPKWKTPYVAIIVQAVLATVFLLVATLGKNSKIEHIYLTILATQVLVYYITYIYLFAAFIVHRRREGINGDIVTAVKSNVGAYIIGIVGLATTLFAMAMTIFPPPGTEDILSYELTTLGGALAFIGLGAVIYTIARIRKRP